MCGRTIAPLIVYAEYSRRKRRMRRLNAFSCRESAGPLPGGQWLLIGTASSTEARRDTMIAMLHSLRIDTASATGAAGHPSAECPAWPTLPDTAATQPLAVGPVEFRVPPDLRQVSGSAYDASWESSGYYRVQICSFSRRRDGSCLRSRRLFQGCRRARWRGAACRSAAIWLNFRVDTTSVIPRLEKSSTTL